MKVKIQKYAVAFLDDDRQVVEHEIEVYGSDRLRAEMEARRSGIASARSSVRQRSSSSRADNVDISDMGDMQNREALELWAACVRLDLYDKPSAKWRNEDYVGCAKEREDGGEGDVDPTPSGPSTGTA